MDNLTNKTSVLFGPVNELALGVAKSLHEAGSRIVFVSAVGETNQRGEDIASLGASAHAMDLNDPQALAGQMAALPPFQIAVFHPGWNEAGEFMETTPEDWDAALQQNFEQMVYAAQAAARSLVERREGGRLLFLSSAFTLMPFLQTSVAGATLSALNAVARMAAVDLGEHGITVNVVARGWLEGDGMKPYLHQEGRAFVEQGIPVARIGRAEDAGAVCCFLASDAAQYVTGAIIPVDGGYTLTRAAGTSPYPQTK